MPKFFTRDIQAYFAQHVIKLYRFCSYSNRKQYGLRDTYCAEKTFDNEIRTSYSIKMGVKEEN